MKAVEGLRRCSDDPPAAAVVHVELQDISGSEFCRLIRGRKRTERLPLILFSSRGGGYAPPVSHMACADASFSRSELSELGPRLRSLIGETAGDNQSPDLTDTYDGRHLKANFDRVQITVDGNRVDLARRELRLLQFLVTHPNHVLARHDILMHAWEGDNDGRSRTIDAHIRRLRMKLGIAGEQIQTLVGVGYRFNEE